MALGLRDRRVYARAMKRLEYGYWGYPLSLFRKVTLTTREGDDNTRRTFLKHLKQLVDSFRKEGYDIECCGVLLPTPGKGLLHWHGLWRIKGGYFLHPLPDPGREAEKEVRKRWKKIHNAYEVDFEPLNREGEFEAYISKHTLKGYVEEHARLNFSKGWTRPGLKEARKVMERFVSKELGRWYITSSGWKLLNEIEKAFCCGENHLWRDGNFALWVHEHQCELYDLSVTDEEAEG
jgi:hypothetical protein